MSFQLFHHYRTHTTHALFDCTLQLLRYFSCRRRRKHTILRAFCVSCVHITWFYSRIEWITLLFIENEMCVWFPLSPLPPARFSHFQRPGRLDAAHAAAATCAGAMFSTPSRARSERDEKKKKQQSTSNSLRASMGDDYRKIFAKVFKQCNNSVAIMCSHLCGKQRAPLIPIHRINQLAEMCIYEDIKFIYYAVMNISIW